MGSDDVIRISPGILGFSKERGENVARSCNAVKRKECFEVNRSDLKDDLGVDNCYGSDVRCFVSMKGHLRI